ncbi:MAG: ABC transporter ATP-binding protein, partial [Gammaproteobacteria bacterium]|nr:ABC transporter ATP-binding protein [Gammaproteobacteria bacterium]
GLIGPNGAGKSSLLSALAGLLEYTGQVEFKGNNLQSLSATEKARGIALQPQFVESAWALSVHDVVSLGRLPWGDSDQDIIKSAMLQANVTELAKRHVDELSGGEKARVWLARVLANQADVLLVDEPVANLDIHYQQDVMRLLSDYAQSGHAVIIAIHDLSLAAKYCDRVCLLNKSKMVKTGRVEEVLTEEILSSVFNTDVFINLQSNPPVVLAR